VVADEFPFWKIVPRQKKIFEIARDDDDFLVKRMLGRSTVRCSHDGIS
jgi:hypothetical protein